ncbi:neuroblastoma breakpoint family member 6-like isoform X1 [Phacochoerus africanus]|uniref:neuroblastoma breakpoint family member 6-like isoform X1 n=1 Tax=Phacochoerus africanus TaxID=41426 RepID=UPI001FD8844B|nr:neuroblastoma breakpoint family member 6-like isoform X1 [Phacochoerus africanus]
MAVSLGPLSDLRAQHKLMRENQELQRQLAQSKQDFRDLREKFLVSEATAYSLANQLQKYQCEGDRDIIESVLGEKLEFKVVKLAERLAEDPALAKRFRELDVLIHAQARELTQLRQKVKEGRDDCVLLVQHLTDLLTHKDLGKDQGQGLREQLTEGHRLAERLARKFSPESHEDEEDDDEEAALTPSVEVQEVAKEEVLQDSQDECISTPSMVQERSDCTQPSGDGTCASDEPKVGPAADGACAGSRAKEDDVPTPPPAENQNGHEEVDGQEPLPPSAEVQEVAKEEVLQAFPDEAVLAPCIQQEGSDCYPPCSDGKLAFDEQKKGSALHGACGCSPAAEGEIPAGPPESQNDHNGVKEPEPPVPRPPSPTRLRGELPPMAERGVPQNSLDGSAWSCPGLPDLSDSFWPYRSAATLSLENVDVPDAQDATSDTWGDCHKVPLSFGRPEMQSSQAQLQTSTQVANDLQLRLDQHLDRGDGKARLHLSPTFRGFPANTDTGDQGPLFQELGLDASIGMKTPPKLEGEGSAASRQECRVCHRLHALSFLKEKIIQRRLQFSKWRLACRFPGLLA